MSHLDPHGMAPAAPARPEPPALPENATPEEKDAHWLKHVYQGDQQPQLTLRAVLMGGLLGMFMSISNLYTTLKLGWAFGVAITACVLSYVLWNGLRRASGGRLTPMSLLENNCMQSTASAAGYSTGGTIGSAFAALFLLQGTHQPWTVVVPFVLLTAALGVFVAIPMKRQMINYEQLKFPSGIAAAETLRSLYSRGGEALHKAWSLILALGAGLLVGLLRGYPMLVQALGEAKRAPEWLTRLAGKFHIPEEIAFRFGAQGKTLAGYSFEPSVLLIGAGMITGLRVSLSMLVASAILYLGVVPWLTRVETERGGEGAFVRPLTRLDVMIAGYAPAQSNAVRAVIQAANPSLSEKALARILEKQDRPVQRLTKKSEADQLEAALVAAGAQVTRRTEAVITPTRWALWCGTAIMVFSSLAAIALQWRTLLRAFGSVKKRAGGAGDPIDQVEVPTAWLVAGLIPITIGMVIMLKLAFDVSLPLGLLAVAMSFVVSLVCCRATGETDTTPIGAMGKVTQLLYALLPGSKGNININLMSAGATSAAGGSSADLLTDLKSGYLLGANARRQFMAQLVGVLFGTLAIVPAWYLMAPDKETLEQRFAMPAANMWRAVAELLTKGSNALQELPALAKESIVFGALIGVLLPVLARFVGRRERFLPSAMGLGLGLVIPFSSALAFVIGAVIATVWEWRNRKQADLFNVPIASGLVAGEGIILAIIAILSTVVGFLALR
ncbi:MAG: hypothetical protein RJA22_1541 [Verrucomicrobiota bacterium]|jgi:uncharacterized oligopeptide transporter (OPT) family protein